MKSAASYTVWSFHLIAPVDKSQRELLFFYIDEMRKGAAGRTTQQSGGYGGGDGGGDGDDGGDGGGDVSDLLALWAQGIRQVSRKIKNKKKFLFSVRL